MNWDILFKTMVVSFILCWLIVVAPVVMAMIYPFLVILGYLLCELMSENDTLKGTGVRK